MFIFCKLRSFIFHICSGNDSFQHVLSWIEWTCSCYSGHESDKGWDRVTSGVCDGQLTDGVELNTTLALRAELQEVAEQAFDPEKAVKEKLQSSTLTKNHISAKAAEGETTKHKWNQSERAGLFAVISVSECTNTLAQRNL